MSPVIGEQTVVLRVPANLPCYKDWDFNVYPGEFRLLKSVLLETLTALIQFERRHYIAMWLFGPGTYRDYKCHLGLRNLLRSEREISEVSLQPYQTTIWSIASEAVFSRHFASYVCPKCRQEYAADQGVVLEWTFGKDLAAHGGRRFECPKSHTVYSTTEWDS